MKENLLTILPKPIQDMIQREWADPQGQRKALIDIIADDASMYGFVPEEIAPCLHAAYYAYESTPKDGDDEQKLSVMFLVAYRAAVKLLSYGKYKATRTESGWMQYEKKNPSHP